VLPSGIHDCSQLASVQSWPSCLKLSFGVLCNGTSACLHQLVEQEPLTSRIMGAMELGTMRFKSGKKQVSTLKMPGKAELPMEDNLSSFQQGSSMPESVSDALGKVHLGREQYTQCSRRGVPLP